MDCYPNKYLKSKSGKFRIKSFVDLFINGEKNTKSWIASILTDFAMTKNRNIYSNFLSHSGLNSNFKGCLLVMRYSCIASFRVKHGMTKKIAFTLAEVLITLGIIGVVAAMTLPTLIANKQKMELQTALKKSYSVLSNALIDMSRDLGETVNPLDYNAQAFVYVYKNYLKVVYYCGTQGCASMSQDEENPDVKNVIKNYMTYNKSKNVGTYIFDDGQMFLVDGSFIMIENPAVSVGSERVFITVDVNGYKKKPNVYGQDLFTFQILNNGKLVPMGSEGTFYNDMSTYCSKNSSNAMNGVACAYKALTDESYWKSLP